MKNVISALVIGAALTVGGSALAQDRIIRQADQTVYKKKTVIDFNDLSITGELTKPQGSYLLNRKKSKFQSLLKYRVNFLPELFNSTDNL
ncbi:MAG: hypothetical protein HC923_05320 [Myxococcales bacterium]|nr:hypothetical protein [Myxococcales bacterium]